MYARSKTSKIEYKVTHKLMLIEIKTKLELKFTAFFCVRLNLEF